MLEDLQTLSSYDFLSNMDFIEMCLAMPMRVSWLAICPIRQ